MGRTVGLTFPEEKPKAAKKPPKAPAEKKAPEKGAEKERDPDG